MHYEIYNKLSTSAELSPSPGAVVFVGDSRDVDFTIFDVGWVGVFGTKDKVSAKRDLKESPTATEWGRCLRSSDNKFRFWIMHIFIFYKW